MKRTPLVTWLTPRILALAIGAAFLMLSGATTGRESVRDQEIATMDSIAPDLSGSVVDLSRSISPVGRELIGKGLESLASNHGIRIAVLVVSELGDETAPQFAARVERSWVLDRTGEVPASLLLLSIKEAEVSIRPAGRLRSLFPNSEAKRQLEALGSPKLAEGDVRGAISSVLGAVEARTNADSSAIAPKPAQESLPLAPPATPVPLEATQSARVVPGDGMGATLLLAILSLLPVALLVTLAAGLSDRVVLWYDWRDFWLSSGIFLAGAAGLALLHVTDRNEALKPAILGLTTLVILLLAIRTTLAAVHYNRSIPIGLMVAIFRICASLLALLLLSTILSKDHRRDRKGAGPIFILLGFLAIWWWVVGRMVNGKRVYASRGWRIAQGGAH